MKKIKQIRYYSEGSINNSSTAVTQASLVSGTVFSDYLPIVQLGIQALPGSKFYVNYSTDPIIIGSTGIYEIDLSGQTQITGLSFDSATITNIANTDNALLIVDIIYEGEEAE